MRPRLGAFPTNKNKPLLSILKTKTNTLSSKEIGSEESIPSLASSADSDDEIRGMRHSLATSLNRLLDGCSPPRRGVGRCVVFDPRVWITIFERSTEEKSLTWYTSSEMERFKRAAIEKIYQNCNTELVPTGTGRLVRRPVHQCKALFTHPALTLDGEDNDDEMTIQRLAKGEMKSVLIVDPHDICLKLFGKAIRTMLPHLTISTARSSEEATKRLMEHKRFDMVIVEERLGLFHDKGDPNRSHPNESGSALIQLLSSQAGGSETLWIGVSAHFETDEERMKDSGADFQWPKPPPSFNKDMRDTLLKALLIKRGRDQAAFTYFGL
jgi:CheY-like chemotaxis protein